MTQILNPHQIHSFLTAIQAEMEEANSLFFATLCEYSEKYSISLDHQKEILSAWGSAL